MSKNGNGVTIFRVSSIENLPTNVTEYVKNNNDCIIFTSDDDRSSTGVPSYKIYNSTNLVTGNIDDTIIQQINTLLNCEYKKCIICDQFLIKSHEEKSALDLVGGNLDRDFYIRAYPDIVSGGFNTPSKAAQHYYKYGEKENRLMSREHFYNLNPEFDSKTYRLLNGISHHISDDRLLVHAHESGENLIKYTLKNSFDAEYYMYNNPDVTAAGFDTPQLAYAHYIKYGRHEGRVCINTGKSIQKNWEITGENIILSPHGGSWYGTHYFGWKGTMHHLHEELIDRGYDKLTYKNTLYFNPWLEELTTWGRDMVTNRWVMDSIIDNDIKLITFVHNPPFEQWETIYKRSTPKSIDELSNQVKTTPGNFNGLLVQHALPELISNDTYYKNCDFRLMQKAEYIYTVSRNHKKYLTRPDILKKFPFLKNKIVSVNHPITDDIKTRFDIKQYKQSKNKQIYHIGWWMRNLKSFNDIKIPGNIHKRLLVKKDFSNLTDIIKSSMYNVELIKHLANDEYIKIFEKNILYMDAFDVTASNLLLECIRCETPVLLNRHPSFEQYIGIDYPMFYDNVKDIESLTSDQFTSLVERTNKYLHNLDKSHVSQQTFNQKILYDLKKLEKKSESVMLSWVTSLYKADEYFDDLCEDFKNQNSKYPDELEWVIVSVKDSHSKKTQKKIADLEKNHHNIRIINITKKEDPGIYKCWELGIKKSTGLYITNANLDDRHDPDFSRYMIDFLSNSPATDIAFAPVVAGKSYVKKYNEHVKKHNDMWFNEYSVGQPLHIENFWNCNSNNTCNPCHSAPVWRREIHEIVGYFDEKKYGSIADWALWLRCIDSNLNIAKSWEGPLSYYRIVDNSYGRTKTDNGKKQALIKQYKFNR